MSSSASVARLTSRRGLLRGSAAGAAGLAVLGLGLPRIASAQRSTIGTSIAAVLGPEFAEIDAHPTRVRLPDEPLMLVDRILAIEGEPRSLSSGRVITEHDVLPGDWYLDGQPPGGRGLLDHDGRRRQQLHRHRQGQRQ